VRSIARGGCAALSLSLLVGALLTVSPGAVSAATVSAAWSAKIGSGGANGSATLQLYTSGTGSLALKLVKLPASTSLAVTLSKGTCSSVGSTILTLPAIKTTSAGAAARTSSLSAAQASAVTAATRGTGKIAIRVGSGSTAKCGPFVALTLATPPVATIPPDQLSKPGVLTVCSDIPYPPQEFFDASGNPTGSDIEIGAEIAKRLGLSSEVENAVFDTIIAAVLGGKCDVVISAQNITPDRQNLVTMIPYFQVGQVFLVAKGNPKNIKVVDDLCGKAIAAESGTTELDYLNGVGDYVGQGLSAACVTQGRPAITVTAYPQDSDALLALQAGQIDAFFADSPVAGYYAAQHPAQFELSPIPFLRAALEGMSVAPSKPAVSAALKAALLSMIADGTYGQILAKYGLSSGAVPADTVNRGK